MRRATRPRKKDWSSMAGTAVGPACEVNPKDVHLGPGRRDDSLGRTTQAGGPGVTDHSVRPQYALQPPFAMKSSWPPLHPPDVPTVSVGATSSPSSGRSTHRPRAGSSHCYNLQYTHSPQCPHRLRGRHQLALLRQVHPEAPAADRGHHRTPPGPAGHAVVAAGRGSRQGGTGGSTVGDAGAAWATIRVRLVAELHKPRIIVRAWTFTMEIWYQSALRIPSAIFPCT